MHLMVTRPELDAGPLAGRLMDLGHEVLREPLLKIVFLHRGGLIPSDTQAVIATSRNGLRALQQDAASLQQATRLPLFAVSAATAAFAHDLGFQTVHAGQGTAESLVPLVTAHCEPEAGCLLHLAGEHVAWDLKGVLKQVGFRFLAPVVYRAEPVQHFSENGWRLLNDGRIDGVILMSPRTARIYLGLMREHKLAGRLREIQAYCLSASVAEPLTEVVGLPVRRASAPKLEALLALINDT